MARQGLPQHRKFTRLVRRLNALYPGLGRLLARGALEELWEPAYDAGDDRLGDSEDIEARCQWPGPDGALTKALLEAGGEGASGFIDADPDRPGKYIIHDLFDHAPAAVHRRYLAEQARLQRGESVSEMRSRAAKKRWSKSQNDANGCNVHPGCIESDANGEHQDAPCNASGANGANSLLTTHHTLHTTHHSKDHADKPRAPELPWITSQDGQQSAAAAGGEPEAPAKRPRALAGDLAALRDVLEDKAPARVELSGEPTKPQAIKIRSYKLTAIEASILGDWLAAGGEHFPMQRGAVLSWKLLAQAGDDLRAQAVAWDRNGRSSTQAIRRAPWQEHEPERVMHPSSANELKRRFTPHDCKPGEACDLCGRGATV